MQNNMQIVTVLGLVSILSKGTIENNNNPIPCIGREKTTANIQISIEIFKMECVTK